MKKENTPEWLCLAACFFFFVMAIIQTVIEKPQSLISFFMPFGFGLFFFLLSMIMNLQTRIERLEKRSLVDASSKSLGEKS